MILVTGTSGFIGEKVYKSLQKKFGKEKVIAFTSSPIEEGRFLLHNNYNFDQNYFVDNKFENIDTIIHIGAFTPKSSSEANDWTKCTSNITNTEKLLSSNFPNLKKIIFTSTLDVYSISNDKIIIEDTDLSPSSLYGWSKLYCEKMILSFAQEKGLISQILRIGHTYGPGEESYKKVIPVSINKILSGNNPQIWGTGEELRAFIYIDDVVSAIVKSLDYNEFFGEVNVVSEQSITVNKLIEKLVSFSSSKEIKIDRHNSDIKGVSFKFDNTKLKKLLLDKETDFNIGILNEWNYMKSLYE